MSSSLEVSVDDRFHDKVTKQGIALLLTSSFAMELLVVFMTTVQVTRMLGLTDVSFDAKSAMGLLHDEFEFEYLACRLFFLQGLLNWLGAISLQLIRDDHNSKTPMGTRNFKRSIGMSIFGVMIMIVAFYNNHLNFYNNYFDMIKRLCAIGFERYFMVWPPRPLPIIALLPFACSARYLWTALSGEAHES